MPVLRWIWIRRLSVRRVHFEEVILCEGKLRLQPAGGGTPQELHRLAPGRTQLMVPSARPGTSVGQGLHPRLPGFGQPRLGLDHHLQSDDTKQSDTKEVLLAVESIECQVNALRRH